MPPPGNATLPRNSGSDFEHRVVPEQNLQQERHVADQFDVTAGEPRHEPIARQPRNADDKTEHGREYDAETGDQQRVEQADPERAAECRRARRIGDQRLADIEAGGIVPEAETARRYGLARRFCAALIDGGIGKAADDDDQHGLQRDIARSAALARCGRLDDISHRAGPQRRRPAARRGSANRQCRTASRPWSIAH